MFSLVTSLAIISIFVMGISILIGDTSNIDMEYLVLSSSGALGGLIYSFMLDGELELPALINKKTFRPGFIGNIFVGIAGAFVAYIALPEELKNVGEVGITIFVAGLVGGFGGMALMYAALGKIIARLEEAELARLEDAEISRQARQEVKKAEDELLVNLTDKEIASIWNLNSKNIQKYQAETRSRANLSFTFAIISMIVGLTVVILGALLIIINKNFDKNTIAGGVISTIGGALSAYITKTFIDVHRLSITQLNTYFSPTGNKRSHFDGSLSC